MHEAVISYVKGVIVECGLSGSVLDLGGRDVNGTTRSLFVTDRYVTVDINDHRSVDVVADAADLNLEERFDVVVSTECFEHTPRAAEIVTAAFRHLHDGGMFVATMAGPGRAPHGSSGEPYPPLGEWYRNVDPGELSDWIVAAGFTDWSIDVDGLDVRCWAKK